MTEIEKLEVLSRLVRQGKPDLLIDRTLDKLLAHKRAEAEAQYRRIRTDVKAFEKQYSMDSPTFKGRYQEGALGDDADFIEWYALWNMLQELEERLSYPDLPGAPHHVHDGSEENVQPGHPMHLMDVLDAIAECLAGRGEV